MTILHRPYIDPTSTPHRPYIDPTSTPHQPYIEPTSTNNDVIGVNVFLLTLMRFLLKKEA